MAEAGSVIVRFLGGNCSSYLAGCPERKYPQRAQISSDPCAQALQFQTMPNTWVTADFHLGHANIIRDCSRPFATVEDMDEAIVERLNASVKPNDVLFGRSCAGLAFRLIRTVSCPAVSAEFASQGHRQ